MLKAFLAPLPAILAVVALGGLAWFLSCELSDFHNYAWDDAFITFDYARNVAEGNGARFNASDPDPTDGTSSPLQLGLVAIAIRLKIDPLVSARALSLVLFLAAPFVLAQAVARLASVPLGIGLLCAVAAWTCLGLTTETGWHLASGMDTILFLVAFVTAMSWVVHFALAGSRPGRLATVSGPLLLTVLAAARPEGPVLAALLLALIPILRNAVRVPSQSGYGSSLAGVAIAFALLAGGLLVLKVWYYGHLLPNAYYVKTQHAIFGSSGGLLPGWLQVGKFLVLRYLPLMILLGGWARLLGVPAQTQRAAALVLLPSTALILLYARAIHESAVGNRYEYPYLAALYGCLALLLGTQWKRSRLTFGWILVFGASLVPVFTRPQLQRFFTDPFEASGWIKQEFVGGALGSLGRDLGETQLGQSATILLSGAGQVPFFSRFRAIDWMGLNTTELSGRYARTVDQVWEYIDARRPDVVYSYLPPASPGVHDRMADPGFKSPSVQYSLSGRASVLLSHWDPNRVAEMLYREMLYVRDHYEFGAAYALNDNWALMAYVRRDSPHRAVIQEVLARSHRADRQVDLKEFYTVDPRALR